LLHYSTRYGYLDCSLVVNHSMSYDYLSVSLKFTKNVVDGRCSCG
jgi:hypothetical protein